MPTHRPRANNDSVRADQPVRRRQLKRSRDGKAIAGVAGGLGAYFGIDPVIVRVALVVLALTTGGIFVVFYIAAIMIIPKESKIEAAERSLAFAKVGDDETKEVSRSSLGASVLIGIGLLALSNKLGLNLDGDFLWPLAFIGFGLAVLWSRRSPGDVATVSPDAIPHLEDEQNPFRTLVDSPIVQRAYDRVTGPSSKNRPIPGATVRPRTVLRPRFSTMATAGFAIVVGLAWLSWSFLGVNPSFRFALSCALVLIGLLMLAGSWFGRPKLITVGVLTTLLLALTSVTGVTLRNGMGEHVVELSADGASRVVRSDVYGAAKEPPASSGYRKHLDIGELVLDARQAVTARTQGVVAQPLSADIGIGEVRFVVPPDVAVIVNASIGMGALIVDDESLVEGIDKSVQRTIPALKPASEGRTRTLRISSQVGIGVIRIDHLESEAPLETSGS